jgi:hypothetical protein
MSFIRLAEQLAETASVIKEHADKLDDAKFLKEADRFTKAFDKFMSALNAVRQGFTPQAAELRMLMEDKFKISEEPFKEAAQLSLKINGKKTAKGKNDTISSYLDKVCKAIIASGKVDYALKLLKKPPLESVIDLSADDEISLLQQVRKLGSLDEDQLEVEMKRLKKNKKELAILADVSKIKYKPETKPETVIKKLIQIGKRYYENTGR